MFKSVSPAHTGEVSHLVLFLQSDDPKEAPIPLTADQISSKALTELVHEGKHTLVYGAAGCDALFAAGEVARRLDALGAVAVELQGDMDWFEVGCAFEMRAWANDVFKVTTAKGRKDLSLKLPSKQAIKDFSEGQKLGQAINFSRSLSFTPPNVATPYWMAEQAQALAKSAGLECTVIKGKDLEKHGLAGLINVGKASENPPCLIRLEYKPAKPKGQPLVLVGKTMTYDTGGLSLKISGGMVGMKGDKDGGCAVLGAMKAIAEVYKPDRPVVALLCAAENSVSDEAYRPDDVITFANGVTVEVTNTDAEGRLVLADGLIWACRNEKPSLVVDIATLTGGVVTALGKVYGGYFASDDATAATMEQASGASGDRIWRLPLHEEYRDLMKSPIADILNSNPNRQAHPIQGAAFLSYFVEEDVPWAHVDIAGVHSSESERGPWIKGPSGFGVRLLSQLAQK